MSKFDKVFNRIIKEDRLDDIANKMRKENDDFFKSTRDKFEKQNRDFYNKTRARLSNGVEDRRTTDYGKGEDEGWYKICPKCKIKYDIKNRYCEECGEPLINSGSKNGRCIK